MQLPLISVIVPIYNAEKYLNRCIDSILVQTYTNFELLLINDGSKDKSGEIIDKYAEKDNRIKVFHKENGGVSSARNKGMKNAFGEYITFIDADDYIISTFLEDFAIENNIDLHAQGVALVYNNRDLNHYYKYDISKICNIKQFYIESVDNNMISGPCSKLYKKHIIELNNITFDESISFGEDSLFIIDYISHCKIAKESNRCGYIYTHENDISLTNYNHSGINIYKFALKHYINTTRFHCEHRIQYETRAKIIQHESLALYNSIIKIITDNYTQYEKRTFIRNLNQGFMRASYNCNLPRFHNFMKWTYRLFPNWLFISIIKFALKLKK